LQAIVDLLLWQRSQQTLTKQNKMKNETIQINEVEMLCYEQQKLNAEFAFNGVPLPFRGHWTTENDGNGIKNLIVQILKSNGSIASVNDSREIQISNGMFSDSIIAEVRKSFGFNRYTDKTIQMYLAVYLLKENRVNCVQLTAKEDNTRTCKRPRCKYFATI